MGCFRNSIYYVVLLKTKLENKAVWQTYLKHFNLRIFFLGFWPQVLPCSGKYFLKVVLKVKAKILQIIMLKLN